MNCICQEKINECIKNNIHLEIKLNDSNKLALELLIIINQKGVSEVFSHIETDNVPDELFVKRIREDPNLWRELMYQFYCS